MIAVIFLAKSSFVIARASLDGPGWAPTA